MSNIWMVLQQTAAASVVALFLLCLQGLFRDKLSPKWQYNIWLVLLCRLVVPAGWGSGTALDLTGLLDTLRVWVELKLDSAWASPWTASMAKAGLPVLPVWGAPRSVTDWLFAAYLAGVLLCALWLFLGWMRLRKLVCRSVPVQGPRLEQVNALADGFGLGRPAQVVESRNAHSPFLAGVFRPTLVVPMGWEVDGKVVLHELLHLKNRDVLAGWVSACFRCVHWCNPLLWWVFDRIDNQREERCDQQVLERLEGEERRDYGRVLLSMAEDRAVRIPGATSMANGAGRIKVRIQSIARFRTFPKGMGLVSVCMTLMLIPNLVVGFAAAEGTDDLALDSAAHALSYAQNNPCTTVAGALDAYARWMYYRVQSPLEALLARTMATEGEDMAEVMAQYEDDWARWSVGTARHEELDRAYRTGPLFRGLHQTGENSWVCQVYMFRDKAPEIGDTLSELPVEYLCHTVEVKRRDSGTHTVELLKQSEGEMNWEADLWREMLAEPDVSWRGKAGDVEVTVYPYQTMLIQGGWINGMTRSLWSFLRADWPRSELPDPDANFSACYGGLAVYLENRGQARHSVKVDLHPQWTWGEPGNQAMDDHYHRVELEAGEQEKWETGTGGVSFYNGIQTEECILPDTITAVLTVDGKEYTLTLEREVSWE